MILIVLIITYFVKKSPIRNVQQLVGFHQYEEAKLLLDKMIGDSRANNYIELLILRATCSLNLNLVDLCLEDIQKIIESNCTIDEKQKSYSIKSQLNIKLGDLRSAEENAQLSNSNRLIELVNDIRLLFSEFYIYLNEKDLTNASETLDKILVHVSLNESLILNRTEIAWNLRDYSNYTKYAFDYENKYPNDPNIHFRKGIIMLCNDSLYNSAFFLSKSLQMRNPPSNSSIALKLVAEINKTIQEMNEFYQKNESKILNEKIKEFHEKSSLFCAEDEKLSQKEYIYYIKFLRLERKYDEAFSRIEKLIVKYPKSLEFVFEKAEIDLELHNFDSAITTYRSIQRNEDPNVEKLIENAFLMKKKSLFIDHYAFLGLDRDRGTQITVQQVKEAYRKVARSWHPDLFSSSSHSKKSNNLFFGKYKKKDAEQMMKHINAAYDILSNQKKKDLYDHGKDPNDTNEGKPPAFSDKFDEFFANPELYEDTNREGPIHIQIQI